MAKQLTVGNGKPTRPNHAHILAPNTVDLSQYPKAPNGTWQRIFLAGSIEMGKATEWQYAMAQHVFDHLPEHNILVTNPRRYDWDGSWKQSKHEPQFRTQVEWELDCQDEATVIAMNFEEDTKSPISLLELGLYAASGNMVVCCGAKFWRRGNIEVICERFNIPLYFSKEEWQEAVVAKLSGKPCPEPIAS